ncbi:PDZ domain-containing protein 9-like [Ascaphus truei]|uniref:PDZ domain-containing protein 9-like n=1 Tax=Ascaphus truei TaxID=8439 RepID=UPI003F597F1D
MGQSCVRSRHHPDTSDDGEPEKHSGARRRSMESKQKLDTISAHDMSPTVKTQIWKEAEGFGMDITLNGHFLQIVRLEENGSVARYGELKPGDVLVKVGKENVMGWSLRELLLLLRKVHIGVVVEVLVYRDLIGLPEEWADGDETCTQIAPEEIAEEAAAKSAQFPEFIQVFVPPAM